ncbi:DNA sulfur modification protein DndB [Priestia endophytica]|uniref:DNA sulfur modification protein DndB n=1 Tax=Priestia endophytica TaxID=135735 RepID=UPI000DCA9102|nr:DNA sulfur modification protein DndB [Priestia endophytica]RAS80757.1 hypothetical protein A4U60_14370 [Priestia endophytica]
MNETNPDLGNLFDFDFKIPKIEKKSASTLMEDKKNIKLKAQVFRQGHRLVYRTVMSFKDVKNSLTHSVEKPVENTELLHDIFTIKNRYLNRKNAEEIINYVLNNRGNFVLPSITVFTNKELEFEPFLTEEEKKKNHFNFNDPLALYRAIPEMGGVINGYVNIEKEKIVGNEGITFETGDGNHRVYSIHKICELIPERDHDGFFIGVDFYVEKSDDKIRNIFVNLNSGVKIDRSVYNLLNGQDALNSATRDLIGHGSNLYAIPHLNNNSDKYIGFDPVSTVGARSKAVFSFNMLRNVILYIALGSPDKYKQFEEEYPPGGVKYYNLLSDIADYLRVVFERTVPFEEIDQNLENVVELRQEYLCLSAAGIYVIAKIGFAGRKNELNMTQLAEAISRINWKREIKTKDENIVPNPLFLGGILGGNGNVSNTRTAIDTTTNNVLNLFNISI